jgi:hypothetical protein
MAHLLDQSWITEGSCVVGYKIVNDEGFIMGALVGGGFGFIVGCWTAISMKKLYIIPVSTVISGGTFGFFMACIDHY